MNQTTSRPTILIVSEFYPSSLKPYHGCFIDRWARQLASHQCDVKIFTIKAITPATYFRFPKDVLEFYRTPFKFAYDWNGLPVSGICIHLPVFGTSTSRTMPWFIYRAVCPELDALYKKTQYDMIYLSGDGGPFAQAIAEYATERRIPFISSAIGGHVNNCCDKPESLAFKKERDVFLKSRLVVCVSEDMKRKVSHMTGGNANAYTFYYGVDPETMRKDDETRWRRRRKLAIQEDSIVLLNVGFQKRVKGVYELIKAFSMVNADLSNTRLLLVGEVIEPLKIKYEIAKRGLTNKVILTGGVVHEQMAAYYNVADIFVHPSWAEGLPNAVMEACSCELPVIATNVGGIPEIIDHQMNGLLVPPHDVTSLYAAIKNILNLHDRGKSLGIAARQRILETFNYHLNGVKLANRIKQLIID